jgi:hypothetical protein
MISYWQPKHNTCPVDDMKQKETFHSISELHLNVYFFNNFAFVGVLLQWLLLLDFDKKDEVYDNKPFQQDFVL